MSTCLKCLCDLNSARLRVRLSLLHVSVASAVSQVLPLLVDELYLEVTYLKTSTATMSTAKLPQ